MAEWHERVVVAQARLRRAYDAYWDAVADEKAIFASFFLRPDAKLRAARRRERLCAELREAKEAEHALLRPDPRDDDARALARPT